MPKAELWHAKSTNYDNKQTTIAMREVKSTRWQNVLYACEMNSLCVVSSLFGYVTKEQNQGPLLTNKARNDRNILSGC